MDEMELECDQLMETFETASEIRCKYIHYSNIVFSLFDLMLVTINTMQYIKLEKDWLREMD